MQKQGSGAVVLLAALSFGGILALFSQVGIADTNAQSSSLNPGRNLLPGSVPHAIRDAGSEYTRGNGQQAERPRRLRLECGHKH